MKKLIIPIVIAMSLAACGGGGGSSPSAPSNPSNPPVAVHPFDKYEGIYAEVCDTSEGSRLYFSVDSIVNNNAIMAGRVDVYANRNCSGPVIGTATFSSNNLLEYKNTVPSQFKMAYEPGFSGEMVTFKMSIPPRLVTVTGTNSKGKCVIRSNNDSICFSDKTTTEVLENTSFYQGPKDELVIGLQTNNVWSVVTTALRIIK